MPKVLAEFHADYKDMHIWSSWAFLMPAIVAFAGGFTLIGWLLSLTTIASLLYHAYRPPLKHIHIWWDESVPGTTVAYRCFGWIDAGLAISSLVAVFALVFPVGPIFQNAQFLVMIFMLTLSGLFYTEVFGAEWNVSHSLWHVFSAVGATLVMLM